jgi:hypothetical protein
MYFPAQNRTSLHHSSNEHVSHYTKGFANIIRRSSVIRSRLFATQNGLKIPVNIA